MKWIFSLCIVVLLASCSSTTPVTEAQLSALETAVNTPEFIFKAQWAEPLDNDATQVLASLNPAGGVVNGNRVNLDRGVYYVKLSGDLVDIDLPYFGTRQISGGLPGSTGIQVKQTNYSDLEQNRSKKEDLRNLTVQVKDGGEFYSISMQLFAGGGASITVSSSHRQAISYSGIWE